LNCYCPVSAASENTGRDAQPQRATLEAGQSLVKAMTAGRIAHSEYARYESPPTSLFLAHPWREEILEYSTSQSRARLEGDTFDGSYDNCVIRVRTAFDLVRRGAEGTCPFTEF
jgi:hypothetical protein